MIEKLSWIHIRDKLALLNPALSAIIDDIDPDERFALYRITYPYGQSITNQGQLLIPNAAGQYLPISAMTHDAHLQHDLSYSVTPMILQWHNYSEVYVERRDYTAPLDCFYPGDLFGLFESISNMTHEKIYPIWDVCSGAKTIHSLANIANAMAHNRLIRAFALRDPVAKNAKQQWYLFRNIINKQQSEHGWYTQVIVFGRDWFEPLRNDVAWLNFQKYLLLASWTQSRYRRAIIEFQMVWEYFSELLAVKKIKATDYLMNTMKHACALASGTVPGFRPICEDDPMMPAKCIMDAYIEHYQLDDYLPSLMVPVRLNKSGYHSLYYSLNCPTALGCARDSAQKRSLLHELEDLSDLMALFISTVSANKFSQVAVDIHKVQLRYFHPSPAATSKIIPTAELADYDEKFAIAADGRATYSLNAAFLKSMFQMTAAI